MEAGKYVTTGGSGHSSCIPVLQGSDTDGPDVRIGVLGAVRSNGEVNGVNPSGGLKVYHWEAGTGSGQQYLENTDSGGGP